MNRTETRYTGVWDAGYHAAMEEVSGEFWRFLRGGGVITAGDPEMLQPRFWVRLNGTNVVTCDSLGALMRYGSRSIDRLPR